MEEHERLLQHVKRWMIPFSLARMVRLTCPAQDLSSVSIFRLLIFLFFCPLACTVIYSRPPYYRYEQYTD